MNAVDSLMMEVACLRACLVDCTTICYVACFDPAAICDLPVLLLLQKCEQLQCCLLHGAAASMLDILTEPKAVFVHCKITMRKLCIQCTC
jgi:hypothetical protein